MTLAGKRSQLWRLAPATWTRTLLAWTPPEQMTENGFHRQDGAFQHRALLGGQTPGDTWSHSDKPLRTLKLPSSALLTGKLFKNVLTIQ